MDFCTLKRWMSLAVIVSAGVLGCWASAPTMAENGHGRELRREKYPEAPARDPGVRAGKRFLAPPILGGASSIGNGRHLFVKVGCRLSYADTKNR